MAIPLLTVPVPFSKLITSRRHCASLTEPMGQSHLVPLPSTSDLCAPSVVALHRAEVSLAAFFFFLPTVSFPDIISLSARSASVSVSYEACLQSIVFTSALESDASMPKSQFLTVERELRGRKGVVPLGP